MTKSDPESVSGFHQMGLSAARMKALEAVNYQTPSPIQAAFIPLAIQGGDCTGQARTGTGKTCAFVIPILERMDLERYELQALVMTPTRELSEQVAVEARKLSGESDIQTVCCVGGRDIRKQIEGLKRGAQLVVGTPGRIIDLITRGVLKLGDIRIVVLDEADRMLDIGFRPDIEKILKKCPTERQTLLLSATMPPPVERLAQRYMRNAQRVDLSEDQVITNAVRQYYVTVDEDRKFDLLLRLLVREKPKQVIVFTRTKRGADKLHDRISKKLPQVAAIHGDLPQSTRDRVMKKFREGMIRLLIATDVMGRGIDVSGISHIINYDIPEFCDDYIHRIGRTGRLSTGVEGSAFTFVTREEGPQLTSIEMRTGVLLDAYAVENFEAFRPKEARVASSSSTESRAASSGRRSAPRRSARMV
ncbi:MAG: DEAD/DEAH box helicase [Planctomycetales bacterium]